MCVYVCVERRLLKLGDELKRLDRWAGSKALGGPKCENEVGSGRRTMVLGGRSIRQSGEKRTGVKV